MNIAALFVNPWAWLVLVGTITVSAGVGEMHGRSVERDKALLREVTAASDAKTLLATETAKVVALEKAHTQAVNDIAATHYRDQQHAKAQIDRLNADVRAGAVRLSIAVKPGACSRAASGDTASAASPVTEARAELSGEAAQFLVGFAGSCDATASQMNAVIDAYEAVRTGTANTNKVQP